MSKESAVEILVFKPNSAIPPDQRGVHENLWIKQHYKQYLSIGVYLDGSDLKYYFFENCDNTPKIYSSLVELKKELPSGLEKIFETTPKLFMMGHGAKYGLCNVHGASEEIYDANFDKIIADFEAALSEQHDEIFVTLEACNTDNRVLAAEGYDLCLMSNNPKREPWKLYIESTNEGLEYEVIGLDNRLKTATMSWDKLNEFPRDASKIKDLKNLLLPKLLDVASNAGHTPSWEIQKKTFLERLSANHPNMTFCGTGPWDPKDGETGYRASGGFPTLNAPITAMGGGIWKNGNSVIFFHDSYQVAVKKSMFASTETAKELKVNTIEYAREILKLTSLDSDAREEIIRNICANREILKIEDLKKAPDFPQGKFEDKEITKKLLAEEKLILEKEKYNYIVRVREILGRAETGDKFRKKDLLIIALGLKDLSIFKDHEDLRDEILANKSLLQLVMVTCGKVLIAGPSNDGIIDLLLKNGIDINSVDEEGMTALHYVVQNFYNYRKEPLKLISKLLDCGANINAEDEEKRTPLMLATEHSRKGTVIAGGNLLKLLEQRGAGAIPVNSHTLRSLMSTNLGFFRKLEDKYLTEHRHDDPRLQHEYDNRFGLVLKK
jgi:hypothetical protein